MTTRIDTERLRAEAEHARVMGLNLVWQARDVLALLAELEAARHVVEAARLYDESYRLGYHKTGRNYHDDTDRFPAVIAAYDRAIAGGEG